jgi:hypothetical protein
MGVATKAVMETVEHSLSVTITTTLSEQPLAEACQYSPSARLFKLRISAKAPKPGLRNE